jgi:predicted site-specific integrase-resolvase
MDVKYLSETKAGEYLGISPKTLSRWRWAGRGPKYRKFGGAVRYATQDLVAYAESCRVDQFVND